MFTTVLMSGRYVKSMKTVTCSPRALVPVLASPGLGLAGALRLVQTGSWTKRSPAPARSNAASAVAVLTLSPAGSQLLVVPNGGGPLGQVEPRHGRWRSAPPHEWRC